MGTHSAPGTSQCPIHPAHQPSETSTVVLEVEVKTSENGACPLVQCHREGTLSTPTLEKGLFWERSPQGLGKSSWRVRSSRVLCDAPANTLTCPVVGPPAWWLEQVLGCTARAVLPRGQRNSTCREVPACLEPASQGRPGEGPGEGTCRSCPQDRKE